MRIQSVLSDKLLNKSLRVLLMRIVGVILLFSVTLIVTNNFSATLVGQYDISRSILFILGSICLLGVNQSIIYYSGYLIAKKSLHSIKNAYQKMLTILLVTSILCVFIYWALPSDVVNGFYEKEVYLLIFKTIATVFFYGILMLNIELFRAIRKIEFSEIVRNIFRHVFFLVGVLLIHWLGYHSWLIEVFLFNFVVLALFSSIAVLIAIHKLDSSPVKINLSYKEILRRSYPMSISIICFFLMQSIDIILLGKFKSFDDVAHYAVAVKLTMIVALVLSAVNTVYAPVISELFSSGHVDKLKGHIKKATRLIFILTSPIIITIYFLSEFILDFFGKGYINGSEALKILLVAQLINAMSGSVGTYLNMTGNEKSFQRILLVALVLNVILNWWLIPKYGIEGAAIATTISTVFWNLYSVWFLFTKKNIKTFIH